MSESIKIFQIDAFTKELFKGNPACVVPLSEWIDDNILLKIAKENAVPETAFFVKKKNSIYLRWFTPDLEMDLCGHATLATAHCLVKHLGYKSNKIKFETFSGILEVSIENGMYFLDFPSRPPERTKLPDLIKSSINISPVEVFKSRDYVLLFESEQQIQDLEINRIIFDQINLGTGGVIMTSKGNNVDFVSRFFTPQATLLEDPVTGSAHCSLTPFWAERLNKQTLDARQISSRGGKLKCENKGERVVVSGKAKTYSEGFICIDL